jgi:hypothetical protein
MDERSQLRSIDAGGNSSSEARPRFSFNWDGSRYNFQRRNIFFTLSNTAGRIRCLTAAKVNASVWISHEPRE